MLLRFLFRRGRTRYAAFGVLTVIASSATLVLAQVPASAIDVSGTPSPVTGNATWFSGLGSPYGGCGLPQSALDSQNFLALNVQNSPGNYSNLPRPISAANASEIGMWDNGLNCGRWVQVTIGNYCTGTNDGAPNLPFCRNGSWISDQYNGATLDFIVGDSCDDGNAWCKDDPYHVDLAQASLNQFVLNGQPVGNMYPDHWNNRQVSWQFIQAPNYTGDIKIGAIQGAQPYWPAIAVSHLPNGIHGVQYMANGTWTNAQMDSDQGDDYIIAPTTGAGTGGSQYQIRVIDASDQLVNGGEVYSFTLPSGCSTGCSPPYTPITYTSSGGGPPPTTPPPTTPPPTTAPPTTAPPTTAPPTTAPPTTPPPPPGGCKVTWSTTNSWQGGFQLGFTVTNSGSSPTTGWNVSYSWPGSQAITQIWSASETQTGASVAISNVSYDGALSPGGNTTFGLIGSGTAPTSLNNLACTVH